MSYKSNIKTNLDSNVPNKLKKDGNFCCWKYEVSKGRKTKVPYNPNNENRAKSNEKATFGSYDDAIISLESRGFDGIGIGMFDGVCAIDIDDCVGKDGKLSHIAEDIVKIMQSYTEYSPSGEGIHILFTVENFEFNKEAYYIMNRNKGLEVYISGATSKYVTVTGNRIGIYELKDCTQQLQVVLDKYMRKENPAVKGVIAVNEKLEVNDGMPERAFNAKNGSKFKKLYYGDLDGYDSQSEADQALCNMLAFWTGKNPMRMDELFRNSALMRDKWDRKWSGSTYGEMTIQKAIASCFAVAPPYNGKSDFLPIKALTNDECDLPEFPVEALPPFIGNYVRAVSQHTQTALDMAGTISLGVLAVCLQGKYQIEGSPGYYEPLSLYTVVIAEPGERKSSVMNAMTESLYQYQEHYNKTHKREMNENKLLRDKLEQQINYAEEKLKNNDDEDLENKILRIQDELDSIPEIKPLRLLADDASMEALTSLLANNNGRIGVVSAEGGVFDNLKGRYSQVQNIDVWLKGHCGDPIMIDRLGRIEEKINHPHLSAILAIQPYVLTEIMSDEKLGGRGLLARFMYCSPPTFVGKRKFGAPGIPEAVKKEYMRLIGKLLDISAGDEPKTLKLSPEAMAKMEVFFAEHEDYLGKEGQIIAEWASKYIGAVLRIAGLIHVASESENLIVSGETIDKAIAIGRYFLEHAKYAYALIGNDKTVKRARHILLSLKEKGEPTIKLWQFDKICRNKLFRTKADIREALQFLEECGYGIIVHPDVLPGPGRKPDDYFKINPLVFEMEL